MSKIWKNKIKVFRKFNLKQRLELKLTAFVVKNLCPNFQNHAPPGKFRVGGPGAKVSARRTNSSVIKGKLVYYSCLEQASSPTLIRSAISLTNFL